MLAFNYYRFGSVLDLGYGDEPATGFTTPLLTGVALLLTSSGKGLLWFCPAVVAGLWGWRAFARAHPAPAALAALLLVSQLAFFGRWWAWHGDWSWGPRYLVAVSRSSCGAGCHSGNTYSANRAPPSRRSSSLLVGVTTGVGVNALGILVDFSAYYRVVGHQLGQGADVADARTEPAFSPLAGHWWLLRAALYDALVQ